MFQYNCCFGGIENPEYETIKIEGFQYNCCFGGIIFLILVDITSSKFQYNCCFGGIPGNAHGNAYRRVSIQLLFRWNVFRIKTFWPIVMFQYNCCFGGIILIIIFYLGNYCFNTTVVSVEYIKFRAFWKLQCRNSGFFQSNFKKTKNCQKSFCYCDYSEI